MAIRLSLSAVKKIVLVLTAVVAAAVYYFIAYFFCYLLINIGLISASDPEPSSHNPLAAKISEVKEGNGAASAVAMATSSDWNANFNVVSAIVSFFSSSSSTPPSSSSEVAAVSSENPAPSDSSVPSNNSAPVAGKHQAFIITPSIQEVIGDTSLLTPPSATPAVENIPAENPSPEASSVGAAPSSGMAPNIADPSLFFGSYFDTFSNNKYIDSAQTSLYYDESSAAYFFPPDYTFGEASADVDAAGKEYLSNISFNDFNGPYGDKRCLNGRCLEQKGKELFFENKKLSLPAELSGSDIAAISIGSLAKRWLVGVTIKNESGYEGMVYYFDGQTFSRLITPAPMISSYFGLLGFGGGENNFLVIYGASKGIAYHIQGDTVSDISSFFDFRIMNGGFKPEVLFTVFETNVNWYVYSSTLYHPVLVKLWQNRGSEIVGEMSFNSIFQLYDESAAFKLDRTEAGVITLLSKIRRDGRDHFFTFQDRGFKNENGGALVSLPIAHDGYASLITIVKIAKSALNIDVMSADKVEFLFSADSQQWIKLGNEQNTDVSVPATRYFLLKAVFPKFTDKFYSPFVSDILFNYYCRK